MVKKLANGQQIDQLFMRVPIAADNCLARAAAHRAKSTAQATLHRFTRAAAQRATVSGDCKPSRGASAPAAGIRTTGDSKLSRGASAPAAGIICTTVLGETSKAARADSAPSQQPRSGAPQFEGNQPGQAHDAPNRQSSSQTRPMAAPPTSPFKKVGCSPASHVPEPTSTRREPPGKLCIATVAVGRRHRPPVAVPPGTDAKLRHEENNPRDSKALQVCQLSQDLCLGSKS